MKKQYFLLFVFILFGIMVFGQEKYEISVSPSTSKDKMNADDSRVKRQYYCVDAKPDSLYLNSDSLIFSNAKLNANFPKLILYDNFKFCFEYNFHSDTIKVVKPDDNTIMMKIITTSKRLQGDWKTIDLQKQISLILINETNNYKIIEKNNRIYFIKTKK